MTGRLCWLFLAVLLAGCASTPPGHGTPAFPLIEPPVLPRVTAEDLACLSDDAYKRLLDRDILRRQYAERLAAAIEGYEKWRASQAR